MNIVIRHAEPGDYEDMQRIFASPEVIRGTMQLPFPSAELWRKRLSEPTEGQYRLVACAEDEVVGTLGLHTFPKRPRRRHAAGIGMAVRDDWQGKGIGTALMAAALDLADNWLNLTRLELTVFADNEPAIRLYDKFGFTTEGTLVQYVLRDGEFSDCITMARIRK
jgi:putative acetyltransferase